MNYTSLLRRQVLLFVTWVGLVSGSGCREGGAKELPPLPLQIVVAANYPGAGATVVAETVAVPIEQQVNGTEGVVRLESLCHEDGRYTLQVRLKPGTDINAALVAVQKRVALAGPQLPEEVRRQGISVRKLISEPVLILTADAESVRLVEQLREELERLVGVGRVAVWGQRESRLRLWLDQDRLAACSLTAADVVSALREQNLRVTAIPGLVIESAERLTDPEKLGNVIVKTLAEGRVIRLRDLGTLEDRAVGGDIVRLNGQPVVALAVYLSDTANPQRVRRAIPDRMAALREKWPDGTKLEVALDFANVSNLAWLELRLPDAASEDRYRDSLLTLEKKVRAMETVEAAITLPVHPFHSERSQRGLCLQLKRTALLPANRETTLRSLRRIQEEMPDALVSLHLLTEPPLEFAIVGPDGKRTEELADRVCAFWNANRNLRTARVDPTTRAREQLQVEIDRERVKTLKVRMEDLFRTLQITFGEAGVQNVPALGRTLQITIVPNERRNPNPAEDLQRLLVRGGEGKLIPLGTLAVVRMTLGPRAIRRVDQRPAMVVSADPATEVSPRQALAACVAGFEAVRKELRLGEDYKLVPIRGPAE